MAFIANWKFAVMKSVILLRSYVGAESAVGAENFALLIE
jgi:hypothetical protein